MKTEKDFTLCHACNRGGRGNDNDKCSCGFRVTKPSELGCFLGIEIIGKPVEQPIMTRSQLRYSRYLEFGDGFDSFIAFCRWHDSKERCW